MTSGEDRRGEDRVGLNARRGGRQHHDHGDADDDPECELGAPRSALAPGRSAGARGARLRRPVTAPSAYRSASRAAGVGCGHMGGVTAPVGIGSGSGPGSAAVAPVSVTAHGRTTPSDVPLVLLPVAQRREQVRHGERAEEAEQEREDRRGVRAARRS